MSVVRATTQLLKQQERLKEQMDDIDVKKEALQAQYDLIGEALERIAPKKKD